MTIDKFDEIVAKASTQGKLMREWQEEAPFSADLTTNEIYDFQGVRVCYQNNRFFWMEENETGKIIKREDCTTFDIASMSIDEIYQLTNDLQKEVKKRQVEQATKAIDKFNQAWQELKQFGEVRIRVSATGEKHFHTTVNKLGLEFLPFN